MAAYSTTFDKKLMLAVILAGGTVVGNVRADEACSLQGDAVMPKGTGIYDAPAGGTQIATFTGAKVGLTITGFPESTGERAQVLTSGFRIRGFVRTKDLPVFTARAIPVHAGHVWIGEGRKVSVLAATGGRLHVEKTASFPMSGYFHGWAPCDAFTFAEKVAPGWTPEGGMRGYVVKKDRVDLYSEPRGDVVTAIEPVSWGNGVLVWTSERNGPWLHVEHHGEIVLNGWLRAQDVSALPPGETMDQQTPPSTQAGTPRLSVQGNTKTITTGREVTLRAKAGEANPLIGSIEPGVEVLVLDVVAGWASVMPKGLSVMPAEGTQFWTRAKDLGI